MHQLHEAMCSVPATPCLMPSNTFEGACAHVAHTFVMVDSVDVPVEGAGGLRGQAPPKHSTDQSTPS